MNVNNMNSSKYNNKQTLTKEQFKEVINERIKEHSKTHPNILRENDLKLLKKYI